MLLIIIVSNICFAQEPTQRIVSTYHPANSLIFGLQAHDRLVGVSKWSDRVRLFRMISPEISGLPQVGSRQSGINIETVISLNPDLIIMPPSVTGKEESKRLQELGFETLILNLENLDDFFITLKILGEKLGKSEDAEKLIQHFDNILKIVDDTTKNVTDKPKCYYASQRDILTTCSAQLLQSIMIERAGGINVARGLMGEKRAITAEQLLLWDPDIIFISANSPETYGTIAANPVYSKLSAVKNGKVYKFPSELSPWDYPSIEVFPAILWLSMKIHPELYTDTDFQKILDNFYTSIYGKSFTDFGGSLND